MATINKDFKVKSGLVVEGTTGTINGYNILTKSTDDQNYIIGLIGGSASSGNNPDTVVLRDNAGSFAAQDITVDGTLYTGSIVESSGVTITADNGDIVLDADGWVYAGTASSGNIVATRGRVDALIGDVTVDSSGGNTITDRIATAKSEAISDANFYADSLAVNYDAAGAATTAENNAKSYADSLATNYDPAGAASTAQTNAEIYADNAMSNHASDTSTHGVSGDIVGTTDVQTLANKTIDGALGFDVNGSQIYDFGTNLVIKGDTDLTLQTNSGDIILNPDGHAYVGSASAGNEIATNSYVDNAVSGLTWKQAVNLLSTTNVDITAGYLTIDGHAVNSTHVGYRILLTGQSTVSENGIYEVVQGIPAAMMALQRAADADTYEELIGAAVYVMEGTQYGSTSWVQGNHYMVDFSTQNWTQFSGQGSVTAGTGIIVDGLEVSVDTDVIATQTNLSDGLALKQDNLTAGEGIYIDGSNTITGRQQSGGGLKFVFNEAAIDRTTTDAWYDASGAASTAEQNAKDYADGLASNYDPAGSATTAYNDAVAYADALDTDDIAEGSTNLYYTDARAKAEAKALLLNAYKTNIEIVENLAGGINITAENGVADSTTDDLEEGTTNLYFTDQRVLDAVDNSTITPAAVEINNYRKEEATQQYVASASTVNVHSFLSPYESAKYLVRVVGTVSGVKHSQLTEILVTLDGNYNVAITEYGTICTNTNNLASFSADYLNGLGVTLTATTEVSGCEIIAAATMLSWAD
jgi:hypothetical protein